MSKLQSLFENNEKWRASKEESHPGFFDESAKGQAPDYLWIGCSDSRVPPNQVLGLDPGEVFVHRNIANVVQHNDLSLMSVVQYAVEALKVRNIIVCGHYGCGGVAASIDGERHGIVDNWIKPIGDLAAVHGDELAELGNDEKIARLCELNALTQARNLSRTTIVQDAWAKGEDVQVHPMIYGLGDGRIKALGDSFSASGSD